LGKRERKSALNLEGGSAAQPGPGKRRGRIPNKRGRKEDRLKGGEERKLITFWEF